VKIKLDEHLPTTVALQLRQRGFDVHTVRDEDLVGSGDAELIRRASGEGRMIFTLDRGFGDVRSYPPGTHPGVVVFRLDEESAPAATAAVLQLVDHHDLDSLRGTITVVQRGMLRVRRPAD
jgi:predicted nuclease of predicted toxin-antitoxin system